MDLEPEGAALATNGTPGGRRRHQRSLQLLAFKAAQPVARTRPQAGSLAAGERALGKQTAKPAAAAAREQPLAAHRAAELLPLLGRHDDV